MTTLASSDCHTALFILTTTATVVPVAVWLVLESLYCFSVSLFSVIMQEVLFLTGIDVLFIKNQHAFLV